MLSQSVFSKVYQMRDRLVILRLVLSRAMPASACEIARDAPWSFTDVEDES